MIARRRNLRRSHTRRDKRPSRSHVGEVDRGLPPSSGAHSFWRPAVLVVANGTGRPRGSKPSAKRLGRGVDFTYPSILAPPPKRIIPVKPWKPSTVETLADDVVTSSKRWTMP